MLLISLFFNVAGSVATFTLSAQRDYYNQLQSERLDVNEANRAIQAAWCTEHNGTIVKINNVNRCTQNNDLNAWLFMPRYYRLTVVQHNNQ